MERITLFLTIAFMFLAAFVAGCTERHTQDRVSQGVHGPSSPAESGQHGPTAQVPRGNQENVDALHQTAGLTSEMTNGKVDVTMEGSGNLAWQGSYEREKRARMESAQLQNAKAQNTPAQQ